MDGRTDFGSYDFQTYLAQTGVALGVGQYGSIPEVTIDTSTTPWTYTTIPPDIKNTFAGESLQNSVLSTNGPSKFGGNSYDYVISPQQDDIKAIQSL